MNTGFRDWGKRVAGAAGLRVRRAGPENRFDAITDCLQLLRARGYVPRVIIDGGANVGDWTRMASRIFPEAQFHLVEPQTGCHAQLSALDGVRCELHKVVITRPGVSTVRLASASGDHAGTGAYAVKDDSAFSPEIDVVEYTATTLDALFAGRVSESDRLLLKMDLENHEIEALEGATALLGRTEVILSEVHFYDVNGTGHVLFDEMLDFLRARDFQLYDFAALYPRPRDQRLRMGDAVFVRKGSPLLADLSWD